MKILIAGHDLKFIKFYIDYLDNSEHQVKIDEWENHIAHDVKKSYELLDWADVIICEWGLGNSVFYSFNKKPNQKLVVRVHRQELETSFLKQVKIDNIDAFITVSPYIYEAFSRTFNLPREKMHLIYNNIDLEKFTNDNYDKREFNIGMVGYLPKLKRLDLALDVFEILYKKDNRYKLYFKGKHPEELRWLWRIDEEREYYEKQFRRIEDADWKDNIVFEPFGEVVDFYNRMEFILSVSDVESFHLAAAEGMACGAFPIVSNWRGSESIYSKDFILSDLNNVEEYISFIRKNKKQFQTRLGRDIKKFDKNIVLKEFNELILK